MDKIRPKCGIADTNWNKKSKDEKAQEIYNVLKEKKFILLLDDIWEELEPQSVGVPHPNETNQSKILFTTRSENVCDQMQAKKFIVEYLTKEEAWDLFCMKVGEKTLDSHPDIRMLAEDVVEKCGGLPLSLITTGRAMAGRTSPQAWKHAIKELRSFPSEVLGMEKEVFFTLKFSYESLPSPTIKKCFLHCALYPEDVVIPLGYLIRAWIGEGFLEEHESIYDGYNHGQHIFESLKLACLLEGDDSGVVMHDVIRDMALWVARDQDQIKSKVLTPGDTLVLSQANLDKWNITERISLVSRETDHCHVPICPNLVTLILDGYASIIDIANVQFMSRLKVLSLVSIKSISTLPAEIGQLIHLEYLRLFEMDIKERFPMEMKNLKNLKIFLMHQVDFSLEIIPLEVISSLEMLRVLSFWAKEFREGKSSLQKMRSLLLIAIHSRPVVEKSFLEQLELLPHLQDLSITLETNTGIKKLLSSTKLQHCARQVGLQQYQKAVINIPIISSMANMEHLDFIALVGLQGSVDESPNNHIYNFRELRSVFIVDCHSITHLTWLKYAPLLKFLVVEKCNLLEEVIMETEDDKDRENMDDIFSNLRDLWLTVLPKLKGVYKKALPSPMLQYIEVRECSNLKKFPFDSNSTRKCLTVVWGETEWWNNLEWEDSATKDLFDSKFSKLD